MVNERRLIDVDEEIKKIQSVLDEHQNDKETTAFSAFVECLKNAPTVDAVEVVRCKDCKHYEEDFCWRWGGIRHSDHFCSYGERREGNGKSTSIK